MDQPKALKIIAGSTIVMSILMLVGAILVPSLPITILLSVLFLASLGTGITASVVWVYNWYCALPEKGSK